MTDRWSAASNLVSVAIPSSMSGDSGAVGRGLTALWDVVVTIVVADRSSAATSE
jgi:hypothetical protein